MPSQTPSSDLAHRLEELLQAKSAEENLEKYFAEPTGTDGGYTGRHFERLTGGGDRSDVAHNITADDLLAVQTLSITVPAETGVQLLQGDLGVQVGKQLRDIPTTVSLTEPEAARHIADDSAADRCWKLLVSDAAPGVGPTTAGKLLARKRPHLIPVYDDVVRCALGHPSNFWANLQRTLVEHHSLHDRLNALRAVTPGHVSLLRILDVVIWMSHEQQHRTTCKIRTSNASAEI